MLDILNVRDENIQIDTKIVTHFEQYVLGSTNGEKQGIIAHFNI